MSKNAISKSQRSGALDLLRFLAVLTVFFAHYTDTFNTVYKIVPQNLKWVPVAKYGFTALLVFFMVSGYVITMTSIKRTIKEFTITRLSRIYPLFWVSCVVAFVLPRLIHNHTYLMYSHFKVFLVNLTMMPQAFGYEMINPVYYTLLVELIFYFLIAFIIIFKLWDKILIVITTLIIICLVYNLKGTISLNVVFPSFIAGMLLYLIKLKYKNMLMLHGLLVLNWLSLLAGCSISAKSLDSFYKTTNALNIWVVFSIATVLHVVFYVITVKKPFLIKHTRFTQLLGEIAYPFYLFHVYFLFPYWYFRDALQPGILLLVILIAVLLASWVINVFIEKPFSKLTSWVLSAFMGLFEKKGKAVHVSGGEPPV
jgi:peptidoglycan/LPS O-acetylase OafA/YrhL